jgi:hypothetical protein
LHCLSCCGIVHFCQQHGGPRIGSYETNFRAVLKIPYFCVDGITGIAYYINPARRGSLAKGTVNGLLLEIVKRIWVRVMRAINSTYYQYQRIQ